MRSVPPLAAVLGPVLAPVLAAVLGVGVALSTAQAPAIAEAADPSAAAGAVDLVIAPEQPVISKIEDGFDVQVLARNALSDPVPASTLRVEISTRPLENPEQLERASAGEAPDDVEFQTLTESRFGETAADGERDARIALDPKTLPFTDVSSAGTYLLRASLEPADGSGDGIDGEAADDSGDAGGDGDAGAGSDGDAATNGDAGAATATAFAPVVWRGPSTRVNLSVVVPLVLPSGVHTLPTRDQLMEFIPRWSALLEESSRLDATLAIDPRVIAGIRAYGENAPESARDFLEALEASPLPSFLLQFADADPSVQAELGMTSLLEPTSFDFVSRFGSPIDGVPENSAENTAENTADSTADSATATDALSDESASDTGEDASVESSDDAENAAEGGLPTIDALTEWPAPGMAWPAENSVTEATLDLVDDAGISSLLVSSTNVTHTGGPATTLDGGTAFVTDATLDASARAALIAETGVERDSAMAHLSARLALTAKTPGQGAILALDRGGVANVDDPAAFLAELADLGFVTPIPMNEQAEGTAELAAADGASEARLEQLRAAANREASVNEVGAILTHPEYLSGYQRTRLMELFATRHSRDAAEFKKTAADYRSRDATLLEGVQVISTEHTQLVGTSTQIPLQLHNSLPFDARVTVQVVPSSAALRLPERSFPGIVVAAEANEALLVPVESRVSSGESGLVITVTAPEGEPTVFTGTLAVSLSSSIETIGVWVLGVLAALLLGFGIWRSVRRKRPRDLPRGDA